MAKKLSITLVRSPLACKPSHRRTVRALGLKKIGQTVIHDATDPIKGMTKTINYLITVEES